MNIKQLLKYIPLILIVVAMAAETLVFTRYQHRVSLFQSPVIWFASGILVCLLAWIIYGKEQDEDLTFGTYLLTIPRVLAVFIPFIAGSIITEAYLAEIFMQYPIDPKSSDIIPALQEIYIDRLQAGKDVYEPYSEYGYTIYPNYLPLAWLPYFISEWLQIDYRWTAYFIFIFALGLWNLRLLKKPFSWVELFLKSALPFLMLRYFILYRETSFGHAVELTIVGFYLILALTIFSKSSLKRAGGILLPLLSRFSYAFWLVFYALTIFIRERKQAWQIAGICTVAILLIYVLPFFIQHPTSFFEGLKYYEKAALVEWQPHSWQDPNDIPFHLKQKASFSIFFYENLEGTVEERLDVARAFHKGMSIGSALLVGLLYFLYRRRVDFRFFALVGLKFTLMFFYGFFYVPFFYLFLLPTFMTLPIIFEIPFGRK